MQRYYHYIHKGIDSKSIVAMDEAMFGKICQVLPAQPCIELENFIRKLIDEVKHNYVFCIKKAIGKQNLSQEHFLSS